MTAFAQNEVLTTTFVTVTISSEPGLTNFPFLLDFCIAISVWLCVCLIGYLKSRMPILCKIFSTCCL